MRRLKMVHGFIRNQDSWPKSLNVKKPCYRMAFLFDSKDTELESHLRELLKPSAQMQIIKTQESLEVYSSAEHLDKLAKQVKLFAEEWACQIDEVTGLIAPQFSVWVKIKEGFCGGRGRQS